MISGPTWRRTLSVKLAGARGGAPPLPPGAERSPAIHSGREAPSSFRRADQAAETVPHFLDDSEVGALIQFFKTLDRWDREFRSSNSNSFEVTL
jgi:hypothetical protein